MSDRVPGMGCIGRRALSLGRGQLISLFITGTGIFASLLSSATPDANFPNLLVLCNYVLLTGYFWQRLWHAGACRRRRHEPLATSSVSKALRADEEIVREGEAEDEEEEGQQQQQKQQSTPVHFGWYIAATILDMGGNWLFIKAYDFTTITSIMLLDCFTIPSAMLLSYLFLRISYKPIHVLGVVICICGLVCIVLSDLYLPTAFSSSSSSSPSTNKFALRDGVLGDVMCILGSVLYAASNVLQEGLVKQGHREEYLGNLGL
jgi:drug/metabolite transporter (DMT)-like permease